MIKEAAIIASLAASAGHDWPDDEHAEQCIDAAESQGVVSACEDKALTSLDYQDKLKQPVLPRPKLLPLFLFSESRSLLELALSSRKALIQLP